MCRRCLKPAARALASLLWAQKQDNVDMSALSGAQHLAGSGRTSFPVDKSLDRDAYRVLGYRQCGERAVRVDILERLADLIRPALSWREASPAAKPPGAFDGRGFVVTQAMTSLTGSAGEDFASILRALGYRMERRLPLPPKPVAVEPAATGTGAASVAGSSAATAESAVVMDAITATLDAAGIASDTPGISEEPVTAASSSLLPDVAFAATPTADAPVAAEAKSPEVEPAETESAEADGLPRPSLLKPSLSQTKSAETEPAADAQPVEAAPVEAAPVEAAPVEAAADAAASVTVKQRKGRKSRRSRPPPPHRQKPLASLRLPRRPMRNRLSPRWSRSGGRVAGRKIAGRMAIATVIAMRAIRIGPRRMARSRLPPPARRPTARGASVMAAAGATAIMISASPAPMRRSKRARHPWKARPRARDDKGGRPPRERFQDRDKGRDRDKSRDNDKGKFAGGRDKGGRDKGGRDRDKGGRDKRPDGGPSHRQYATTAPPRERDRPADPNSPFAKLAALKEQLTANRKDR